MTLWLVYAYLTTRLADWMVVSAELRVTLFG